MPENDPDSMLPEACKPFIFNPDNFTRMKNGMEGEICIRGYNVAKYLPFGPVKEVMPYLMRRLDENSSISFQTNRELKLIEKEIVRKLTLLENLLENLLLENWVRNSTEAENFLLLIF